MFKLFCNHVPPEYSKFELRNRPHSLDCFGVHTKFIYIVGKYEIKHLKHIAVLGSTTRIF